MFNKLTFVTGQLIRYAGSSMSESHASQLFINTTHDFVLEVHMLLCCVRVFVILFFSTCWNTTIFTYFKALVGIPKTYNDFLS